MGSPLKDLFNKDEEKKEAETPKRTPKKAVSGVTTAKAKAALEMMESKSDKKKELVEMKKEKDLEKQKEAIAKKTNQDIINAAYKVAEELKLKGGPWPLMRAAGWGHLTDNRGDLYKGPAIHEIEALTDEQKAALIKVLDL